MTARRRKTTAPARTSTKDRAARAGARPPADHLARTEATGDTITFTWGDWEFTTDKDALDDYKRISMLNAGFADPMLAVLIPDADLRNEPGSPWAGRRGWPGWRRPPPRPPVLLRWGRWPGRHPGPCDACSPSARAGVGGREAVGFKGYTAL